jgi:hypothetical protein
MHVISVRHRECGGDLVKLEFDTPPTLEDVVALGTRLLAEYFRKVGHYQAQWPLKCDNCGSDLSFEVSRAAGAKRPVVSYLDRNVGVPRIASERTAHAWCDADPTGRRHHRRTR